MSMDSSIQLRLACDRCHAKKVKCLPGGPGQTCDRCAQHGVLCNFSPPSKTGRPSHFRPSPSPSTAGDSADRRRSIAAETAHMTGGFVPSEQYNMMNDMIHFDHHGGQEKTFDIIPNLGFHGIENSTFDFEMDPLMCYDSIANPQDRLPQTTHVEHFPRNQLFTTTMESDAFSFPSIVPTNYYASAPHSSESISNMSLPTTQTTTSAMQCNLDMTSHLSTDLHTNEILHHLAHAEQQILQHSQSLVASSPASTDSLLDSPSLGPLLQATEQVYTLMNAHYISHSSTRQPTDSATTLSFTSASIRALDACERLAQLLLQERRQPNFLQVPSTTNFTTIHSPSPCSSRSSNTGSPFPPPCKRRRSNRSASVPSAMSPPPFQNQNHNHSTRDEQPDTQQIHIGGFQPPRDLARRLLAQTTLYQISMLHVGLLHMQSSITSTTPTIVTTGFPIPLAALPGGYAGHGGGGGGATTASGHALQHLVRELVGKAEAVRAMVEGRVVS